MAHQERSRQCRFKRGSLKVHVIKQHLPWFWYPELDCWECRGQAGRLGSVGQVTSHLRRTGHRAYSTTDHLDEWIALVNGALTFLMTELRCANLWELADYYYRFRVVTDSPMELSAEEQRRIHAFVEQCQSGRAERSHFQPLFHWRAMASLAKHLSVPSKNDLKKWQRPEPWEVMPPLPALVHDEPPSHETMMQPPPPDVRVPTPPPPHQPDAATLPLAPVNAPSGEPTTPAMCQSPPMVGQPPVVPGSVYIYIHPYGYIPLQTGLPGALPPPPGLPVAPSLAVPATPVAPAVPLYGPDHFSQPRSTTVTVAPITKPLDGLVTLNTTTTPTTTESQERAMEDAVRAIASGMVPPTPTPTPSPEAPVEHPRQETDIQWVSPAARSAPVPVVDSHFHLDRLSKQLRLSGFSPSILQDLEQHVQTWVEPPVELRFCIASFCDPASWPWLDRNKTLPTLALDTDPRLRVTIGVHPKEAHLADEGDLLRFEDLLAASQVVGLGEVGLDYTIGGPPGIGNVQQHRIQRDLLRTMARIAVDRQLPLVLHIRDHGDGTAADDCLRILQHVVPPGHPLHWHCFTGDFGVMRRWTRVFPNTWFGFTAKLIDRPSRGLEDAVRRMPLDRLLLESDAPYLRPSAAAPPVYPTGSGSKPPNHPWLLGHVCQRVAELRRESATTIGQATTRAARQLYGI